MSSEQDPWERLLDLTVFAPVGLCLTVRDDLPKLIQQGRQAIQNRVMFARFIGEYAVKQGQQLLSVRIEAYNQSRSADAIPSPIDVTAVVVDPPPPSVVEAVDGATSDTTSTDSGDASVRASMLPIAEYESLAASQVVHRLGSLHPDELDAIRQFEVAHRARRTVLGKIAQLQGE